MELRQKEKWPNWQYRNVEMWAEKKEYLLFNIIMFYMCKLHRHLKYVTKMIQKEET